MPMWVVSEGSLYHNISTVAHVILSVYIAVVTHLVVIVVMVDDIMMHTSCQFDIYAV